MGKTWRIGVAGLGVVGGALVASLAERPTFAPAGGAAIVTGVSARRRTAERAGGAEWFDNPVALATSPSIDIFVELIGGAEGPARAAVEAALRAGKPVVTANKALIACHGAELAALAEDRGVALLFEAAVMGGTPAVKMLREAIVGDEVELVAGILNGTCNFILSEMERTERPFAAVLAEAQALGFAEADPTTDVGGFDAGHKITILAALAFGCAPTFSAARIAGIDTVELLDIELAKALGYRIKLVASATRRGEGVSVEVRPALTPLGHPLAETGGALNALFIESRRIGRIFVQGPGAGGGPTAAAVVADIADIMTGASRPVFQKPASELRGCAAAAVDAEIPAYIRLLVRDEPGVIARVGEILAEQGVSIDSFLQRPVDGGGGVPIVMTTHPAPESALDAAVARMAALSALIAPVRVIQIARI
jgi:homoserine dehydrogenase